MELQTNPFLHRWHTHMSRNSYLVFVKPKAIVCAQICVKGTHCADQYMADVLYLICKWQKYIDTRVLPRTSLEGQTTWSKMVKIDQNRRGGGGGGSGIIMA